MAAIVINVAGSYDSKAIKQAQDELGKLDKSAKDTNGSFGKVMKGVGIAALAGGAAVGVMGKTFVDWAKEAQDALAVSRTTDAIIKSVGATSWTSSKQVTALADSLSEKTGIDDEQIQSASNLLLTFKNVQNAGEGSAAVFDRATAAALDLSKAGFGSVDGAAKMLGKALNDPTKGISALGRAGVTFTEEQKKQIAALQESGDLLGAQAIIMAEVESQVGGVAEAAASPFEQLTTMLGNFKEEVGSALLPAIDRIVEAIGPVLDQLAGPLGAIAGELGTQLAGIFEELAPLFPPLGEALVTIVGLLGDNLMTAVASLVPVVTPLLTVLAELAQQIGPILAPLLAKVGELIGALFAAVAPLLPPLTELVMTVLGGAADIVLLVADALLALIGGLTPVFDAVSQLLPPFNDLIQVVLAAIMPILEPLLPVISTLAELLGVVLTKAVAALMLYWGKLLTLLAPVAGWILNNLAKPVVDGFLQMAQGVLDAADSMFGWVPGVGDKIGEAQAALAGFRDKAGDAISQAADSISTEGTRIGEEMMANAQAMLSDPDPMRKGTKEMGDNVATALQAQTPAMAKEGEKAGKGLADGVRTEIERQAPAVADEAYRMGKDAADAVKDGAQVSSPSKLTVYVGRMITEGLLKGMREDADLTKQEAARIVQDGIGAAADAARVALDKLQQRGRDFIDFAKQVGQSMADFGSITSLQMGDNMVPTAQGVVANMRQRLNIIRKFGQQLQRLRKLGLNNGSLQEIVAAGPEAGSQIAAALLQQGEGAIRQVNTLERQLNMAGASIGRQAASSEFGGMTMAEARGMTQTNIRVDEGAVVVNIGAGTSAQDSRAIQRAVNEAVRQALTEYAREQRRSNRTRTG